MTEKQTLEQKVRDLKAELQASDYKVIKCAESNLLGTELEYDVDALSKERQAIRDEINELEQKLANMGDE